MYCYVHKHLEEKQNNMFSLHEKQYTFDKKNTEQ